MSTHTFTVEEILNAAEQNKYKNDNYSFINYKNYEIKDEVITACVIGEAFLNLGLVENGTDAASLSRALVSVKPDNGEVHIPITYSYKTYSGKIVKETEDSYFTNLSSFINELNGLAGYKGKKRIVKLARKYFSKSLKQEVTF